MTSKEISEITGKDHSNVLRDIRSLIDEVGEQFKYESSSYLASNNKQQVLLILEKESVQLLITGYSAIIRLKVIQRLNELESKIDRPVIKSRLELARENVLLLEEIEAKDALLLEAKPKLEFYDQVTGCSDTIDIGQAAKVLNLGFGRTTLFERLRELKVLMPNNNPMQKYIDNGWFRVIESKYNKPDGSTHISLKTVVYQKGLDGISKILK